MSCKNSDGVMLVNTFKKNFSQFFNIRVEYPLKFFERKYQVSSSKMTLNFVAQNQNTEYQIASKLCKLQLISYVPDP